MYFHVVLASCYKGDETVVYVACYVVVSHSLSVVVSRGSVY